MHSPQMPHSLLHVVYLLLFLLPFLSLSATVYGIRLPFKAYLYLSLPGGCFIWAMSKEALVLGLMRC